MKVFKFIGTTIITTFFLFNVASCSNDDDTFAEEEESENVDFTNYISTNLKVNGKTFWYEPNWSGVHISDWGDNDRGIYFSFEGKTEDTDNESIIKISLNESLSMADCVNNNKNIATYLFFNTCIGLSAYEYSHGKATIRETNGIITLSFDVMFKNSENGDIKIINGYINYNIKKNNKHVLKMILDCKTMKTIKTTLLTIVMLLCNISASAHDFEVDGIFYNISSIEELTVEVTSGDNLYRGNIIIPEEVVFKGKTLKVTNIGNSAFHGCSYLKSITIPNSVTNIGNSAFYGCSDLNSITIPNSVTNIGNSAFHSCDDLTSVTIGNGVRSIGESVFSFCSNLTSITIPNSVTSIGDWAFFDCI